MYLKEFYSGFTYAHLLTYYDLDQTIAAKYAFGKLVLAYEVNVEQYHAAFGYFTCKWFRDVVLKGNQKITCCGIGAHHQNNIVESIIGLLTRWSGISVIHASRK